MRDRTVGETFYIAFTTRAFATGIPTQLAGSPVISAYEDAGLTQITAGLTLGVDHDSVTGLNMITVVATGGNGFEAGKDYQLVITTGTVGGVSVVGEVVGQFSLGLGAAFTRLGAPVGTSISADLVAIDNFVDELESRLTAARAGYLDELAAANIPADLTTITNYVDALETRLTAARAGYLDNLNGHTAQTGDSFARIGVNGAGLSALPYNAAWDAEIQSEVNDALIAFFTSAVQLVDDIWDEPLAAHNTAQTAGQVLKKIDEGWTSAEATVTDAGATTTSFVTDLVSAVDDFYVDQILIFISGALSGQARVITTYNGTTKVVTFDEALTSAPVNGVDFIILATHVHSVGQIADAVLDELLSGHATVGSLGKAITDTEIGAALIAAIKAKTDSLTFTKANEVDANIQSINDVTIVGDGDATPFDV